MLIWAGKMQQLVGDADAYPTIHILGLDVDNMDFEE
jgi:hypothetical protein